MNDSFGASGFNATATGSGAAQENKAEGILPLTIGQILESSEDGIQLYGVHYSMLSLLAIVRNVEHSSTKITYRLEDHSGQLDAHLWLEEGNSDKVPGVSTDTYARVIGSVRNHGGTKTVMIFHINQISSPNEVTTHLLEVLNARYKGEQYAKGAAGGAEGASEQPSASTGGFMETDGNAMGLSGKQLVVFKAIKNHMSDTGISRQELQKKFSHINAAELATIVDYMTQEGIIYTSVDSDHFLCVDA
ncbi:replication protein A 32 kDa subunit [Wyeomyia smithii]|uniref:replication protein A 32 kDa subunit n=1 Tax=Wyeomyia smithii TaxID=174621 RepID=UPI002467B037|nr:replication protein A 32 kDa subunit [Wyeomyia smithii]